MTYSHVFLALNQLFTVYHYNFTNYLIIVLNNYEKKKTKLISYKNVARSRRKTRYRMSG